MNFFGRQYQLNMHTSSANVVRLRFTLVSYVWRTLMYVSLPPFQHGLINTAISLLMLQIPNNITNKHCKQ